MLGMVLSPDAATFNPLLVECCRKDDACEAENVFDEMLRYGVVPDLISFGSVIGVFSRNGRFDKAL